MSKGLALTRTNHKPELIFTFEGSKGDIVTARMTVEIVGAKKAKVVVDAPESVTVMRGELLTE